MGFYTFDERGGFASNRSYSTDRPASTLRKNSPKDKLELCQTQRQTKTFRLTEFGLYLLVMIYETDACSRCPQNRAEPQVLVNIISKRVRQLGRLSSAGRVRSEADVMDVALKEVAEGKLGYE